MKIFSYFIIVLCFTVFLTSCEFSCAPVFDGGGRLHTTGKIVDSSGRPVEDVYIQIIGCRQFPYLHICDGDSYCAIAAVGKTDVNGHFSVLHSENTADYYYLVLNPRDIHTIHTSRDTVYDKRAIDMDVADYQNFSLDLGVLEY
jgi:hypothetical protein